METVLYNIILDSMILGSSALLPRPLVGKSADKQKVRCFAYNPFLLRNNYYIHVEGP